MLLRPPPLPVTKPRGGRSFGWELEVATGVSADGKTIVGTGTYFGDTEAWIATVPEPGRVGSLGVASLITLALRRRRKRDLSGLEDAALKPYAEHYFEYDAQRRVSRQYVQGLGPATSGGLASGRRRSWPSRTSAAR